MSYITDPKGAQFGLFKTEVDPSCFTQCGQRFHTEDGREVVLVENGTVAIVAGTLLQNSPIVANHINLDVLTYTALNVTTGIPAFITATLGATKANENQYQGGFVQVNSGPGIGQVLRIQSSSATAASGTITVILEDSAVVALTASSNITLIAAPYTGVVINPTTATASPAGVALYAIPASVANTYDGTTGKLVTVGTPEFGFIVVQGITACLSDVTVAAAGLGIIPSTATAGAITLGTATGAKIGSAYQTSVSAEARAIFLNI